MNTNVPRGGESSEIGSSCRPPSALAEADLHPAVYTGAALARMSGTSPVCLVIWSVWSIWLVSCNQTNQTDRTDQMNKTGWRTFSASC